MEKINAISLFSSAGIGELLLPKNIQVVVANELLPKRAHCYSFFYPKTKMISGDITNKDNKDLILSYAKKNNAKLLIATPPCQGFSTLGKNKFQEAFLEDQRNFLIFSVFDIIDNHPFDYILIENVPSFLKMFFPYKKEFLCLKDILEDKYSSEYNIDIQVLNAKDFGVPQSRPRAIVRLWKKGLTWELPRVQPEITLFQAIGNLPSLEAGEDSGIKWHYAKPENERAVLALRHTATGESAIYNPVYYPRKPDGTRIKGFHNTYRRMNWDEPCPARTMYNGSMSSHNNVHPGHKNDDGTYSDARVLTLLETFIVSSIPIGIEFPSGTTDSFIRTIIGEAIPPLLLSKIISKIGE